MEAQDTNRQWTVYIHTNKLNGKKYIGITSKRNPAHRWNGGRGYQANPHFYAAIQKYGWDGFEHTIIASNLTSEAAKSMEQTLIAKYHTQDTAYGYNMTAGGDGSCGCHPSEETRRKLSTARRKENLSEETLQRRSIGLRGRHFSAEHRRKIGDANSKPVEMLDANQRVVSTFQSAHEAEMTTGISHSHISQCCHQQRLTAGGYQWRFTQTL